MTSHLGGSQPRNEGNSLCALSLKLSVSALAWPLKLSPHWGAPALMLLFLHPCCQAQLVTQARKLHPDPRASTSLHLSGFTLPCPWASGGLPFPHPSQGCSLDLGARPIVSNLPFPPASPLELPV